MIFGISFSSFFSWLFMFFSIFSFFFCLVLMWSGVFIIIDWDIFSIYSYNFSISFIMDWVGLSFSFLVFFISSCVMRFSVDYMLDEIYIRRFIYLVGLFVLSMNFLVFIPNLIFILIGWDGLGLVSFLLVIYYQNSKSLSAGMVTVLMNRVGDVMILFSIGLLISSGSWNIMSIMNFHSGFLVCFFVLVAAMTKSAQMPFSSWLPAAMAAPTPVSALVHSSTLVTAGVFLLIRFYSFLSEFEWFFSLLMLISCLTMFMAGFSANMEGDLKKVIALSTLSQLGVMMFSLSMGLPMLALMHLYCHALFKALLFVCAGSVIHNCQHIQDMRFLGSLWNQSPVLVTSLNVANFSLCGFPFLAGFYSKDLILESFVAFDWNFMIFMLVFFATGMTAMYSIRLSFFSMWSSSSFFPFSSLYEDFEHLLVAMLSLVSFSVLSGAFYFFFFFDFFNVLVVSFFFKFLAFIFTVSGFFFGWMLFCFSDYLKSNYNFFGNFGSSMWYLVYLSTQFVIIYPFKVGVSSFFVLDRGWNEFFGGQGLSFFSGFSSSFVVGWQNSMIFSQYIMLIVFLFIYLCTFFFVFL